MSVEKEIARLQADNRRLRLQMRKVIGERETARALVSELLAALKGMVEQIADPTNGHHNLYDFTHGARFADARAAIAKAEGNT